MYPHILYPHNPVRTSCTCMLCTFTHAPAHSGTRTSCTCTLLHIHKCSRTSLYLPTSAPPHPCAFAVMELQVRVSERSCIRIPFHPSNCCALSHSFYHIYFIYRCKFDARCALSQTYAPWAKHLRYSKKKRKQKRKKGKQCTCKDEIELVSE